MYKPRDTDNARVAEDRLAPQEKVTTQESDGLFATGLRQVRRVVVLVVGGVVLLGGVVMLVTPGPGLVGIAVGLGILSIEFAWARSLLHKFKQKYMDARDSIKGKKTDQPAEEKQDTRD